MPVAGRGYLSKLPWDPSTENSILAAVKQHLQAAQGAASMGQPCCNRCIHLSSAVILCLCY